jgi:SAM-dependent methyltransferase
MSARLNAPLEAEKSRVEWGEQQASALWTNLYKRYDPIIDGRVILDLGCSWGYMLMYLHKHFRPRKTIGVDVASLWDTVPHGWDYKALLDRSEFHAGLLPELDGIQRGSVDYVLCTSVLQYMRPEMIVATLECVYDLLRPGGEMILRTRCFTSYIGADMHSYYNQDYVHLLHPLNVVRHDLKAWLGRDARYLNYLTASNYIALFNQSGLEALDIRRRNNSQSPDLMEKIQAAYPWISSDELLCAEVEARLLRPIEPDDLDGLGKSKHTNQPAT